MPIYLYTAIRAIQAVAQDEFWVKMRAPDPRVSMPRGRMLPWRERGNIANIVPDAFGSQFVLDPDNPTAGLTPRLFAGVP
jgi:hypothetical protein